MRVKSTIKTDLKGLTSLKRKLRVLDGKNVKVGYWDTQSHPNSDKNLAQIALINERGYFGLPVRDFMWTSFFAWKQSYSQNTAKNVVQNYLYRNQNINSLMKGIGEDMNYMIKWVIDADSFFVPNSPVTVKLKGSAVPLIDTGFMMNNAKIKLGNSVK